MGSKIDVMKGGDERILLPMFLSRGKDVKDVHVFQYRFSIFEPVQNMKQMFSTVFRTLAVLSNTIYGLQHI